ncbi:hypothetical protein AB1K54_13550 [Microbacterium sp. BWT-B31]|uniref:hypothetical protein n=1 Tax=Microbacterium sp. BWT-B31 TaxID=3232072 RepID=UPI003528C778
MSIVLAVSGLVVLTIALVLFVRSKRDAPQGNAISNGRGLVLLTVLGLMLGLASQLPFFKG